MSSDDRWTRISDVFRAALPDADVVSAIRTVAHDRLGCDATSIMVRSGSGLMSLGGAVALADGADGCQVTLGEGPSMLADTADLPVMSADISQVDSRWMGAGLSLLDCGVRAVAAAPLRQGSARLGVMSCYWTAQHAVPAEGYADLLAIADVATELVLQYLADTEIDLDRALSGTALGSPIVQQAVGMLAERYGTPVAEAQIRLRAMAYSAEESLEVRAQRIVQRSAHDAEEA
jgi:hypothetical protein